MDRYKYMDIWKQFTKGRILSLSLYQSIPKKQSNKQKKYQKLPILVIWLSSSILSPAPFPKKTVVSLCRKFSTWYSLGSRTSLTVAAHWGRGEVTLSLPTPGSLSATCFWQLESSEDFWRPDILPGTDQTSATDWTVPLPPKSLPGTSLGLKITNQFLLIGTKNLNWQKVIRISKIST